MASFSTVRAGTRTGFRRFRGFFTATVLAVPAALMAASVPAGADPPLMFPGAKIGYLYPDGRTETCTAGFLVITSDSSPGFLTAGHCAPETGRKVYGAAPDGMAAVGVSRVVALSESTMVDPDIALVDMGGWQVSIGTADVNGIPLSGASTAAELYRSNPRLCKMGQRTAWTCGPMMNVTGDKVSFRAASRHGDSGSPVVALWPDGKITAVGILDGSPSDDDGIVVAQLVSVWLESWALQLA